MTVVAVLAHRGVFEQERPALFGVTLVASVVDRIRPQQRFGVAAVRIVAIRAHKLAFAHRHMRRAEHLRAPVLVALEAGVRLECGLELELARHGLHDRVAIGAHQAARLVRAAVPIGAIAALMAGQTNGVVLGCRARHIVRPERDDPAHAASAARLHVRRTRAVAVLAVELALLRHADAAHQRLLEFRSLARMTGQANLGADESSFNGLARVLAARDRTFRSGRGRGAILQPVDQIVRSG